MGGQYLGTNLLIKEEMEPLGSNNALISIPSAIKDHEFVPSAALFSFVRFQQ